MSEGLQAASATEEDLSLLSPETLSARDLRRLPDSLEAALAEFSSYQKLRAAFPDRFPNIYIAHKLCEWAHVADMNVEQRFAEYLSTY